MATAKPALGLQSLSIDQKAAQFATIEASMTGSLIFASPSPDLASVRAKCDAMTAAQLKRDKAKVAAEQATTELTQAEADYVVEATALASYVSNVAKGDKAIIQSAGMPVAEATARPIGKLPAPEGLAATMGDVPGDVDAHWHTVPRARAYIVAYGQNGPTNLTRQTVVTRSRSELTGLTSGQEVWLQVEAVGAEGGIPSQPVRCMVP